ncbi:MAG: discoidin domain-containing protein [Fimbriimonadales bacterium]
MITCAVAALGLAAAAQVDLRNEVNVALTAWGYSHASASSSYGAGYDAERALDGAWKSQQHNKWNSAGETGQKWLKVDLGHAFTIDAIVVRHEGVFAEGNRYNTSDFEIQRSDTANGPWADLVPPVKSNRLDVTVHRFPPVRSRYLRLYVTKGEPNANRFARIYEFEAYAPKDSIDVPMVSLAWPEIPRFRTVGGKLQSAAHVNNAVGRVDKFIIDGKPQTPSQDGTLWVPAEDRPAQVTLNTGIGPRWNLVDDRAWYADLQGGAIHLVSSSHQDVAWIDTPEWCQENRTKLILGPAIDMMERDPRYRFTMENMLNLFELLQLRPERRPEIEKLLREGRLEFGGTYNQPYESLLGGEQLIRQTYFGRRWLRKQFSGCDTDFAYTVDVPGRSLQMQQILAKAGIRYLVTSRYHEGLYRWFSPDGSSVLVYAHAHYGNYGGTLKERPEDAVRDLPAAVRPFATDFASRNIPPHFMVLNSQDFERPVDFAPLIEKWAQQPPIAILDGKPLDAPKLDYSSTRTLFHSVDTLTAKPKEIEGERPNMWLYIHGPTHHEAIQEQREAARLLPVAETFATMRSLIEGSFASYPQEKLSNGWLDSLYPDHGFGGKNGHITDAVFHAKFRSGRDAARESLSQSLPAIAKHVKTDPAKGVPVVVFNPHSWTRSDTVTVRAPNHSKNWIVVDSHGNRMPAQTSSLACQDRFGARVVSATGKGGETLVAKDWWDPRRGHWESPMPAEATIDLGYYLRVERILLRHYGVYGEFNNETRYNTRGFRLLGAKTLGGPWHDMAAPVTSNQNPISVFEFAPRFVRYLRIQVTDPNQGADGLARLVGLDVFGPAYTGPKITFNAANIPSLGYRTFYLRSTKAEPSKPADGTVIENDFYRIRLTPGGIASLYDKEAMAEVFRRQGIVPGEVFTLKSEGNGAGEFGAVQQPTMDGFDRTSAHRPTWHRVADRSGPVCSVYELTQDMGGAKVRQTLVVYNAIKRIDFDVDLGGWTGAKYREFRVAFPIGGPKARVSYEVPMGTVRIGEDEIKTTGGRTYGSLDYWQECKDIHPREVQDCIQVRDGSLVTTLSSGVSVFDFMDPTGMAGRGPLIQPILLASRKSCHWEGNWYTQPGDHHFHLSLTSSRDSRSGWQDAAAAQLPLMAVVGSGSKRGDLPSSLSFASVSMPNVRISTIKKAEDDDSVIVRCYEVEGKPSVGRLSLFQPIGSTRGCNIIEDEERSLPVTSGVASVRLGRYSIETFKLDPRRNRHRREGSDHA